MNLMVGTVTCFVGLFELCWGRVRQLKEKSQRLGNVELNTTLLITNFNRSWSLKNIAIFMSSDE